MSCCTLCVDIFIYFAIIQCYPYEVEYPKYGLFLCYMLPLYMQQLEEAERSFTLDETIPPTPDSEDYGELQCRQD